MKVKYICVIVAMCCLCGAVSVTMTISSFVTVIVSMFVPTLLKKKDCLKSLLLFSAFTMVGSTMMMGFSHALWKLYLWNFTCGIGVGIGSFVLATILINNWIYANHGLIISIVFCFSGMPGALLSSTFSGWINMYGWQSAYLMVAAVIVVFFALSVLFCHKH